MLNFLSKTWKGRLTQTAALRGSFMEVEDLGSWLELEQVVAQRFACPWSRQSLWCVWESQGSRGRAETHASRE